jgi:hypothetical protein
MAFDRVRGNVVMFGGTNDVTVLPRTTWIWNGSTWTEKTTTAQPPAISAVAMDWDGILGQIMMFGGNSPPCTPVCLDFNTTFGFNGTTWTNLKPATLPPVRAGGRIVYDSTRKQVVLFGGSGINGTQVGFFLNDTWVWDGTNWTQKFPVNSPPARYYPQMAYDPGHQQVVLFSGLTWNDFMLSDTWTWDGTNWTQQNPATFPVGRYDATMAYDAALKAVILFGGNQQARADLALNDTWAWTGTTWKQLSTTASPPARWRHGMAYDAIRNAMVIFGGLTGPTGTSTLLGDTWTLHQ